jgi:hypothetical protein
MIALIFFVLLFIGLIVGFEIINWLSERESKTA